jgi:D-amino peptidase
MLVLISADMEGTCGVSSWIHVTSPETGGGPVSTAEYERARRRMTREVNAAVAGALAGGAQGVIVNDSHGGMRNLIPEELHPAVRFVAGSDKPLGMMQGVDEPGVGAAYFTGYHARAGTPAAPLSHTWSGFINDVRVNGTSLGEYGINALIAGHYGVPVTLVTGDDKAVAQTRELLGEVVVGVVVKQGLSHTSATHLHPDDAAQQIHDGAQRAICVAEEVEPYRLPTNAAIEIDLDHQSRVTHACNLAGVERVDWRTLVYRPVDAIEMIATFRAIASAGSRL